VLSNVSFLNSVDHDLFYSFTQVQDLKFATLATVSRCGMVWFSEDTLTPEMVMRNYLNRLRHISLDQEADTELTGTSAPSSLAVSAFNPYSEDNEVVHKY